MFLHFQTSAPFYMPYELLGMMNYWWMSHCCWLLWARDLKFNSSLYKSSGINCRHLQIPLLCHLPEEIIAKTLLSLLSQSVPRWIPLLTHQSRPLIPLQLRGWKWYGIKSHPGKWEPWILMKQIVMVF